MLSLHSATSDRWLAQVLGHLDELLVDHAHCEKKADGVALGLVFAYPEHVGLCREMTGIVEDIGSGA